MEQPKDNKSITNYGSIISDNMMASFDSNDQSVKFDMSCETMDDDEETQLVESKEQNDREQFHASTSIYQSIANTSNYFGFGSTSYAVAKLKERAFLTSKTISLTDRPSVDRHTPTFVSFFQEMSFISGLTIFALPLIVANTGIPMIIAIVLGGIALWYSTYLINQCQYQYSRSTARKKRVYENYIDLGRAAIHKKGGRVMKILVGSSVLTDIYTLIFCAQISKDLARGQLELDDQVWMVIWMAVVFPLFFIRRMSILAWLGFFSIVLYVIALIGVFGILIYHHYLWDWTNLIPKEFKVSYVFIGYGIIVNSFNVHLSMPAIEASMKKPVSFSKMNIIAFSANVLLKVFLVLAAVATFGISTDGSVLANFIIYGRAGLVINILIGMYMVTQYPTSLFVVFEMLDMYIWPKFSFLKKGHWTEYVWLIFSRLLVTLLITFVAVSIPNFEMVTGFIGNIRGTLATLVFPIFFYIRIHKRHLSKSSIVFHWFLIGVVSCLGLAGATFAILGMFGHIY